MYQEVPRIGMDRTRPLIYQIETDKMVRQRGRQSRSEVETNYVIVENFRLDKELPAKVVSALEDSVRLVTMRRYKAPTLEHIREENPRVLLAQDVSLTNMDPAQRIEYVLKAIRDDMQHLLEMDSKERRAAIQRRLRGYPKRQALWRFELRQSSPAVQMARYKREAMSDYWFQMRFIMACKQFAGKGDGDQPQGAQEEEEEEKGEEEGLKEPEEKEEEEKEEEEYGASLSAGRTSARAVRSDGKKCMPMEIQAFVIPGDGAREASIARIENCVFNLLDGVSDQELANARVVYVFQTESMIPNAPITTDYSPIVCTEFEIDLDADGKPLTSVDEAAKASLDSAFASVLKNLTTPNWPEGPVIINVIVDFGDVQSRDFFAKTLQEGLINKIVGRHPIVRFLYARAISDAMTKFSYVAPLKPTLPSNCILRNIEVRKQ